jgi:hypothetical protein
MRFNLWIALILAPLMPAILYAQDANDSLVQELYVKSGLQKQIEQVPLVLQATLEQASQEDHATRTLPTNVISAIKASAQKAFAPAILKEAVVLAFKEKLAAQEIKEVLDWLDSPTGKKCTQSEEAASTPQAETDLRQYAAQMQNSPPTQQRVDLVRKLDSAMKVSENHVDLAINARVVVFMAIMAALPLEQQRSVDDISREVEKHRPQIEATVRSRLLIYLLYTYKDLTDAEIQQYIEFATSPVGSKYLSVGTTALTKALMGSGIRWGKSIGDAIKQLKTQTGT